MMQATIAATVVEMPGGRLALLVEMGLEHGLGPIVVDPASQGLGLADPNSPEAPG